MNSELTDEFIRLYQKLPQRIKTIAKRNYKIWKENPRHPGLSFKRIHKSKPIYSIRVGIGWRAIGIKKDKNTMIWFWIGSHSEYNNLLK